MDEINLMSSSRGSSPFQKQMNINQSTRSFLSIDPILNGFAKTVLFSTDYCKEENLNADDETENAISFKNTPDVFSSANLFQMWKNPIQY